MIVDDVKTISRRPMMFYKFFSAGFIAFLLLKNATTRHQDVLKDAPPETP
jgi:hypothetical protein